MAVSPAPVLVNGRAGDVQAAAGGVAEDAVSALVNLGYRRIEAFAAVAKVQRRLAEESPAAEAALDALILGGLRELAS